MLIPIGFFRGGAAAGAYELISSTILSASQATITFDVSTFASTYKHLQIRAAARTDRTGSSLDQIRLRFNSDSGANYSQHALDGNGTAVSSAGNASVTQFSLGYNPSSTNGASIFGATVADILDPFSSTKYKTVRSLDGFLGNATYISLSSGSWMNTATVTGITLLPIGANFVSGSRFSLYGIRG